MLGNPQLEFKTVDAHTIEVEAKEITDEHIYKLEAIRKKLDTYNIKEMIWFEYDYEPYYSWGERQTVTPNIRKYENYEKLLNHLIKKSQSDRRNGWSNRINFLNITLKLQDETFLEDTMHDITISDDLVKLLICTVLQKRGLTDEENKFLRRMEHQYFYNGDKE